MQDVQPVEAHTLHPVEQHNPDNNEYPLVHEEHTPFMQLTQFFGQHELLANKYPALHDEHTPAKQAAQFIGQQ